MPATAPCLLLPPGADFPRATAQWLLQQHHDALPDLSSLTLVVPQLALADALRTALLDAAGGALLMPQLCTLRQLATPVTPPASPLACRLRLAEAMARFRFVFPSETPLRIADALFALFELLEQQAIELPDDATELEALLRKGYGSEQAIAALSREAEIVHRLHQAFREELGDQAPAVAQRKALHRRLQDWPADQPLVFAGFDALSASEASAVRLALQKPAVRWLSQGRQEGRDGLACQRLFEQLGQAPTMLPVAVSDRSLWLNAAFASEPAAHRRAQALAEMPLQLGNLALVAATNPEHEAQCADLAVREALLAGARRVAVVCNDRRLARRLRARLERAHITLNDQGGWALSTSRAAAALDSWLDCVEQNFPFRPLFALLKSGFVVGGIVWADALEPRAYRAGIAGGATRWRSEIAPEEKAQWAQLLHAAQAVSTLSGQHPADAHADALLESLQRLGLQTTLAPDPAGARLLARLEELREALAGTGLKLHWSAFRALLDTALEDASFPSSSQRHGPVQLLTLGQTAGLAADAVVLTGATNALFASPDSPFFNASVRRELGLPGAQQAQALCLARLRQLLEAAPLVRLLFAPEQAGEEAQLAPPLLLLQAFAEAAGHPLPNDVALAERAPLAEIANDSPLPERRQRAAPPAQAGLLSRPLSAHGHQTLINCPYAFHARYTLGLEALEEPDAGVDRSDYGERVHRILCAFEQSLEGLPPPYTGPRDSAHQADMQAHLLHLAEAVFAADLAERPLGRFWLQAFANSTPWLAEQLASWPAATVEVEAARRVDCAGWTLGGRADRIEQDPTRRRVVDYKTGLLPRQKDVEAGEAVQLPHYALLVGEVSEAEYWSLKTQQTQALDAETLASLLPPIRNRLGEMATALAQGVAMPAHGAEAVCQHCDYRGVCRKQDWERA